MEHINSENDLLKIFNKIYFFVGSELCYLLPDELSGLFEPMLKELEIRQNELGLTSFGISATTLEDVFMK